LGLSQAPSTTPAPGLSSFRVKGQQAKTADRAIQATHQMHRASQRAFGTAQQGTACGEILSPKKGLEFSDLTSRNGELTNIKW